MKNCSIFLFQITRYSILLLLQYLLTILGFMLLVLPGIYLALAYSLAIPLKVKHDLGTWEALETSRTVLSKCWFQLLGLYFLMGLATVLGGVFTLGIGFVWLIPWFMLTLGVMYNKIFGCADLRN